MIGLRAPLRSFMCGCILEASDIQFPSFLAGLFAFENTKWLYNETPPAWNFKINYVKREETLMGSLEP